MRSINIILSILVSLSFIACKKNTNTKPVIAANSNQLFTVSGDTISIKFSFNKETIKCEKPCEFKVFKYFVVLDKDNQKLVYNRYGQLAYIGPKETVEVTRHYLKSFKGNIETVMNGYTGKVVLKVNRSSDQLKISDNFLLLKSGKTVKIWNLYGQVLLQHKAKKYIKSFISNGFVAFQADNRKVVAYTSGLRRLMDYKFKKPTTVNINLNDSFFYFKLGKKISSLYHKSGTPLMRFDGRPSEKIFLTKEAAGFYDLSRSASFWDDKGQHIKSFTKQSGLEVILAEDKIKYRSHQNEDFKAVN